MIEDLEQGDVKRFSGTLSSLYRLFFFIGPTRMFLRLLGEGVLVCSSRTSIEEEGAESEITLLGVAHHY